MEIIDFINSTNASGGSIRLLGGRAVSYLCKAYIPECLIRSSSDIDLFIKSHDRALLSSSLREYGFSPDREFNILNGKERMIFDKNGLKVDVFIDSFNMSHRLHIKNRLNVCNITLSPADLLLTKVQIYEINKKDLIDIAALIIASVSDKGGTCMIDMNYVARCLSKDWGLWKTTMGNLDILRRRCKELIPSHSWHRKMLIDGCNELVRVINCHSKAIPWKVRSILGERIRWYDCPEEPTT